MADNRSYLGAGIDRSVTFREAPATSGFMTGLKAALIGAPVGAAVQALRGHDALAGALLGAIIPGLLAGLAKAGTKKLENLGTEAELRYHAQNIKDREPEFFLPPRQQMGKYFSRRFGG
jgi:hypothetical protein